MRFDVVTIFPEFFAGPLDYGIVRRARQSGLINVNVQDLRVFTHDRHRTVDDRPFGGGEGMVLKPEPLFEAVEALLGQRVGPAAAARAMTALPEESAAVPTTAGPGPAKSASAVADSASPMNSATTSASESAAKEAAASALPDMTEHALPASTAIILLSASGKPFRQSAARRLAQFDRVILLCGRYEGVDERVAEHLATEELSIGDFVLSGGELAAALVIDAVTRLLPGALGNEASSLFESFSAPQNAQPQATNAPGPPAAAVAPPLLLEFPHYTRPADFRGWQVPEVLLGGSHEEIRLWRQRMALEKTRRNRPDLLNVNVRDPDASS